MAGKFCDGFDYLVAGNMGLKWDVTSGTIVGGFYSRGKALNGVSTAFVHTLNTNYASGMIGLHVQLTSFGGGQILYQYRDGVGNATQVDIRNDGAGGVFFTRNGTAIGSTSAIRLTLNQVYWLESQVVIDPALGIANLYINNVSALAQTGLNTRNTVNNFFTAVGPGSGNSNVTYDNFHFWDFTVGDSATGFPYGEHIIDTELANAVGTNTTWNRGGTNTGNNYSQLNEANEDGDTTYVFMSSSGAGDIDSYGFVNLQETGTIGFVAINTIVRIDDAGPHTYEHYTLSNGSAAVSAAQTPGANYINIQTFQGTDPHTGLPWTVAGRNAAEFGFEFIS